MLIASFLPEQIKWPSCTARRVETRFAKFALCRFIGKDQGTLDLAQALILAILIEAIIDCAGIRKLHKHSPISSATARKHTKPVANGVVTNGVAHEDSKVVLLYIPLQFYILTEPSSRWNSTTTREARQSQSFLQKPRKRSF